MIPYIVQSMEKRYLLRSIQFENRRCQYYHDQDLFQQALQEASWHLNPIGMETFYKNINLYDKRSNFMEKISDTEIKESYQTGTVVYTVSEEICSCSYFKQFFLCRHIIFYRVQENLPVFDLRMFHEALLKTSSSDTSSNPVVDFDESPRSPGMSMVLEETTSKKKVMTKPQKYNKAFDVCKELAEIISFQDEKTFLKWLDITQELVNAVRNNSDFYVKRSSCPNNQDNSNDTCTHAETISENHSEKEADILTTSLQSVNINDNDVGISQVNCSVVANNVIVETETSADILEEIDIGNIPISMVDELPEIPYTTIASRKELDEYEVCDVEPSSLEKIQFLNVIKKRGRPSLNRQENKKQKMSSIHAQMNLPMKNCFDDNNTNFLIRKRKERSDKGKKRNKVRCDKGVKRGSQKDMDKTLEESQNFKLRKTKAPRNLDAINKQYGERVPDICSTCHFKLLQNPEDESDQIVNCKKCYTFLHKSCEKACATCDNI